MNFERLRGMWLVTGGLLLLAALFFVFVLRPQQKAIASLRAELGQTMQAGGDGVTKATRILTLERELESSRAYVEKWAHFTPPVKEMGRLYGQISTLAEESGLRTTRFAPGEPRVLATLRRIPLEMQCTSTFGGLWEFLRNLEGLPAFIWVEDMEIQQNAAKQDELQWQIKLVVFADQSEISD